MGLKKIRDNQNVDKLLQTPVGSGLTYLDWVKIVHPTMDGFVSVATKNVVGEWKERSYPVEYWYEHIVKHPEISCFYGVNTMYKPRRGNAFARHINTFYVDLDVYNVGMSKEDAINHIDFLVAKELLLEPTMIVDSGQGLYVFWKIEDVPAKYSSVQKLYSHLEKFLIESLKECGADPNACDIARVLKVPSTHNHKNGAVVKVLRYTKSIYTMRLMQQLYNDIEGVDWSIDTKEFIKNDRPKKARIKGKIKYLYTFYSLAVARSKDLELLCKIRDFEMYGHLNTVLHIYAYQMFLIHNNYFVARSKVIELNNKFVDQLSLREIDSLCKSTFKAYEQHREDPTKGYNYRTNTIIDKMKMTMEEQRKMSTLIGPEVKQERNTVAKREKRRGEDGLTTRERSKLEKVKQVHELKEQGLNQVEIALKMNIGKGTVSKYLKIEKP